MRKKTVLIGLLLFSVHINPCIGRDVEDDPENIKMREEARQEAQEECNECIKGVWTSVRRMFYPQGTVSCKKAGKAPGRVDRNTKEKMR